jgi:hypothetical protein
MLGEGGINLINGIKEFDKMNKPENPFMKYILAFSGFFVLLLIPVILLVVQSLGITSDIKKIKDYLYDPAVIEKSEEIDAVVKETGYFNRIRFNLKSRKTADSLKPAADNRILDLITKTNSAKIEVLSIDFSEAKGIFRVSAKSDTYEDSAGYVEAMRGSDIIKEILYTGYSNDRLNKYNFTIEIKTAVKEEAVKVKGEK